MALYPNTPFTEGDGWTPDLAYQAFYSPIFDGQNQYLGHREKIRDDELSDDPAATKTKINTINDSFKVSIQSGLILKYNSGYYSSVSGQVISVASATVTAPDNSTNFVYLDQAGVVRCGASLPVTRYILARVVTSGGSVTTLEDWRMVYIKAIQPITSSIKIFGGSSVTDKVCSANEVFDLGYYYYRDFTVPSGVSITIDKFAKIYCSGQVTIAGTININSASAGARGYTAQIVAGTNQGGLSGAGAGGGSGSTTTGGRAYNFAAQPYGSGGGLGYISDGAASGQLGTGGDGAGGLWIEAAKAIAVTGYIYAKGADASDPATYTGTPSISGSGGGSGGLVLLSSLTSVAVSGTVDVRGGNGSKGINNGAGGGSGGGGFIVLLSPSNNTTGSTLLLTGGVAGANGAGASVNLGGGAGGGFGGVGGVSNSIPSGAGRLVSLNYVPIGS